MEIHRKNTYISYYSFMKKFRKNIIAILFIIIESIFIITFSCLADNVDRLGRDVEDIIRPTAPIKVDEDKISDALRRKVDVIGNDVDAKKNIVSSEIINDQDMRINKLENDKPYTLISYTASITYVDEGTYEIINDEYTGRIKLLIKENNQIDEEFLIYNVERFATKGFYNVKGKTYYFDENSLMLLGLAKDTRDNYYYFSPETGESISGTEPLKIK